MTISKNSFDDIFTGIKKLAEDETNDPKIRLEAYKLLLQEYHNENSFDQGLSDEALDDLYEKAKK